MSGNKAIALIGHLGRGNSSLDGQTLRTKLVLAELEKRAALPVIAVDTGWISRRPLRVLYKTFRAFRQANIVLIMPGERGLRVLLPFYQILGSLCGRAIHYLVVGGWLPDFVHDRPKTVTRLQKVNGIYVQSTRMVASLQAAGLSNVRFLPNFKDFREPIPARAATQDQLSLVFLSRIIPDKGVEHCFEALRILAERNRRPKVRLDLWGAIPDQYKEWFENLLQRNVPGVHYKGPLEPGLVVDRLSQYDAMLFPTWYRGEGFPGVIIDAYAAGIPVIASDWHDNAEFVTDLQTGVIFETGSIDQLVASISRLLEQPELLAQMKHAATTAAKNYHVDVVLPPLLRQLGIEQK